MSETLIFFNDILKNCFIKITSFNDVIFINEDLNCFYKFFNFYITFNMFLIEIINAISSIKRNFILIEFNKIKINLIKIIKINNLLKNVEIDDNDKRFKNLFD